MQRKRQMQWVGISLCRFSSIWELPCVRLYITHLSLRSSLLFILLANRIEYNPNQRKCETHTDGMMDRKDNSSTMCCEKREVSINRVPDPPPSSDEGECIMCTNEPTSWMIRNNKRCDNWTWGVTTGRRCNDTPENTEYPYWERNHFCELSCAIARNGKNYPDRPRCCQLEYLK